MKINWDDFYLSYEKVHDKDGGGYRAYYPAFGYAVYGVGNTIEDTNASLENSKQGFEQFLINTPEYELPKVIQWDFYTVRYSQNKNRPPSVDCPAFNFEVVGETLGELAANLEIARQKIQLTYEKDPAIKLPPFDVTRPKLTWVKHEECYEDCVHIKYICHELQNLVTYDTVTDYATSYPESKDSRFYIAGTCAGSSLLNVQYYAEYAAHKDLAERVRQQEEEDLKKKKEEELKMKCKETLELMHRLIGDDD